MTESAGATWQTAPFNPDQYDNDASDPFQLLRSGALGGGESRGNSQPTGIRALMLAVLEDGIRCFLGRETQARVEAELWMRTASQGWPFAFFSVCHTLGLQPDAVRAAVYRMRERQLPARRLFGRTRPNVRRRGRIILRRSQVARPR